jgi:hypothetical protein
VFMMSIGIHCILLMSLVAPIFIDLDILEHALSVELISSLGINISIYQHLRSRLVLQMDCIGRSYCSGRIPKIMFLMLNLTFT